jgi:SAM-dependent methyltransferase
LSPDSQEGLLFQLDDLRRAYDRGATDRNTLEDLQWRAGVLEQWLRDLPLAARLLELGPGTGQLAAHAIRLGAQVHAVDLSPRNVEYCQQRGVSASVGDLRALGRINGLGRFDGVYSINALLHVPRVEHAGVIAGFRRCLVPGGRLLLVNWGGRDEEGIWADDNCIPPRFFSFYDDDTFGTLAFEGFEVLRREFLRDHTLDGLHPQLLALRRVPLYEKTNQ